METPRWMVLSRPGALLTGLLLLVAITFNLVRLYPEVAIRVPLLNDGVLHRLAFERAAAALAAGQDPTDPWLAPVVLGYPLFHHYQNLAYLIPATLSFPFGGILPAVDLLNWSRYLLLCLFPLSIYWSMRRFGFNPLPAALAGLVAPLLATDGLYGFDLSSYIWRGYGMYTQLWGMLLLPLTLAQGYTALKTGRGYFWAVLLLAATMLSHLVYGYIAFISLSLLAILPFLGPRTRDEGAGDLWTKGKRLTLLAILVMLVTAYFLVPFLLDSPYMNRSVWEERGKYEAYGYQWTLRALVRGDLFDFGRFPSLTLLVGLGLLVCLWHWREERYRIPVALSILWLLLYFGRPTWGVLLDLLPLTGDLHLHRLIAGVHLGGIMLMGLGLALPWQWALSRRKAQHLAIAAFLTTALLYPVYKERNLFLGENARWMVESQAAYDEEAQDIDALIETLQQLPPGRVYAGRGGNWGKEYKVGAVPVYALLNTAGLDTLGYLYHALSLNADIQVHFDESRPEQYNLFNVRYVVAPTDRTFTEFVQPIGDFGRHRLYQVATSGYFDLVGSDAAFIGSKIDFYSAASHWLESDLPRAKQHPALFFEGVPGDYERLFPLSQAREVIPLASFPLESPRGRGNSEAVESNAYETEIDVERESYLMLKASYHPNWRASVDGVEADTVMLMPSYVGVKVAPGIHHVRLEYGPRSWRRILWIAGLLVLPLIALAEWRREELRRWNRSIPLYRALSPIKSATFQRSLWGRFLPVRENLRPHFPHMGVLLLLTILAGLPLFQFKIMSGHDALEYLPRTVEFYEGLMAGQFFPRWAPDFSSGYGQPFFNFNPPLFYYLSALFHFMGLNFVASQNLAIFALLSLAGLGMYLLAGEFFGVRGGLVSAVAYIFTPYLLVTLYVRHALADFSAFAFIPFAFWGLYRYVQEGRYWPMLVGTLAMSLLLLSSSPVALITIPILALFLGWLAYMGKSRRALLRGLWCLLLGLGLAAFFWLPALVERDFVQTSRLLEGYLNYRNHFVYFSQFILSPWGYGLSQPGPVDGMTFALGPIHLFLFLTALAIIWGIRLSGGRARLAVVFFLMLVLMAGFFASTASLFLWERLSLLQYLQFPWRFLSLVAVSSAFVCGFPFLFLKSVDTRLATGLMVGVIIILFIFGFSNAHPETFLEARDVDYSGESIAARDIAVTTTREYEPVWVSERPQTPVEERVTLIKGQARVDDASISPAYYELHVTVMESTRLRVNTFYFPGWVLYVDGIERPIEINDPQGLMEFSLEPGNHLVQLQFTDTPVRLLGIGLSIVALCFLFLSPNLMSRIIKYLRSIRVW